MAMADIDNDGDLDLFAGGRVMPGKYPEAASSVLFRQNNGQFQIDPENTKVLQEIGLVSAAVFSDLDGDGNPDLILACECGPLKILRNEHGRLVAWDPPITGKLPVPGSKLQSLSQLTGLWNGVTTGDFDGDGRMDIAASNWGENSAYQSQMTDGITVVYGDLDGAGAEDVIEAYDDPDLKKLVASRMLSFYARGMPSVRERFKTYEAFARASIQEICGEHWQSTRQLHLNWLLSTVFLNRGDHFEVHALPVEAQMAPAFGICAADLDGDGNEDLFLSQNFFAVQPGTPRYDAGRGLLLLGDGAGNFRAVSGQESGIEIYGEQRGAAVCDYDADGRIDLAVSQNGAETKLYHNALAKPGLRIRLVGPVGNPSGVGAVLRLGSEEKLGPAREIHGGSGYWSQDSVVQVMSFKAAPTKILVRWPGGKTTSSDVPAGASEIAVTPDGHIQTQGVR